jgi:hypothetical protein
VSQNCHHKASQQLHSAHSTMRALSIIGHTEPPEDWERRRLGLMEQAGLRDPEENNCHEPYRGRNQVPRLITRQGPSDPRHRVLWCSLCSLTGHMARYCATPHQKCLALRIGHCIIKPYHHHYYTNFQRVCIYQGRQRDTETLGQLQTVNRAEAQDQGDTLYDNTESSD